MSDGHAKLQYVYNDCIYCGESVLVPLRCRLVIYVCDRCKVRLQEYSAWLSMHSSENGPSESTQEIEL